MLSENGRENAQINDAGQVKSTDKSVRSLSARSIPAKAQVARLPRQQQTRPRLLYLPRTVDLDVFGAKKRQAEREARREEGEAGRERMKQGWRACGRVLWTLRSRCKAGGRARGGADSGSRSGRNGVRSGRLIWWGGQGDWFVDVSAGDRSEKRVRDVEKCWVAKAWGRSR